MPTADSQLQYMVPAGPQLASDGFNPKGGLFRVFLGRADQGPEEGQVIIQAVVPRRTPLEFWQLPTPFGYAANLAGGLRRRGLYSDVWMEGWLAHESTTKFSISWVKKPLTAPRTPQVTNINTLPRPFCGGSSESA